MSFTRSPSWQKTPTFPSEYSRKRRFILQSPTGKLENGMTFRPKTGSICPGFTGKSVSKISHRERQRPEMARTLPGGTEGDYRPAER